MLPFALYKGSLLPFVTKTAIMKSDEYNLKNIIGSTTADMRKCAGFTQEEFARMISPSDTIHELITLMSFVPK